MIRLIPSPALIQLLGSMENEGVIEVLLPPPAANVEIPAEPPEIGVVVIDEIEVPRVVNVNPFPEIVVIDDNEPEAMDVEGENPDDEESRETVNSASENSRVKQLVIDPDDSDPGTQCTICYSTYDTGEHKLCCLKCGHLFGLSCIQHWLKVGCHHTNRKCPSCNAKASLRDIRILYAKTLLAADTSEIQRLTKTIEKIQNEKIMLESVIKNSNLRIELLQQQICKQEATIKRLMEHSGSTERINTGHKVGAYCTKLVNTFKLSEQGECRVLAHSSHLSLLLASQSSGNPLFPGYGVRKINSYDMKIAQYVKLHDKPIRDMAFGYHERGNLLSVSVDCTAKLFDVQSNAVVQTFGVPEPLWSCCWSSTDPYRVFCGSVAGSFYVFDRRHARAEPEHVVKIPNQKTGLISLCSIPPRPGRFMPNGGILACSLTSILAFYPSGETYESKVLPIDGQFLSMRYNQSTDNVLISAKSTATWKAPRHLVCQLAQYGGDTRSDIDTLHTYYATRNPSVLSRSTFVPTSSGDQLICAYNDRDKTLDAWSMVNDKKLDVQNVCLPDPVLDLCSFPSSDSEITVPCLSAKNLHVVKLECKS